VNSNTLNGALSTKTLLKEYTDNTELVASRTVGNKRYELKDHLGNVRATVTDRRPLTEMPEVLSANNYYPFGMLQPQNSYMAGDYRFGFNGKEMDNEVSGTGNQYDYGFRIYNPRIGKFLSVDPLTKSYPYYSPYQFAGNMPILAVDLDGLEPKKSNEANWNYRPELLNKYYPNYKGNDIHMFTYHYAEDNKDYTIVRQDWSSGEDIYDFRYWALASNGKKWIKFQPTSRLDGLSEDLTIFAGIMFGIAGGTVGMAVAAESGFLGSMLNTSWKSILGGMGKDFVNQMVIEKGNIKEVDFVNVAASGLIKIKWLKMQLLQHLILLWKGITRQKMLRILPLSF
jgi:RHS repeat-associated protein